MKNIRILNFLAILSLVIIGCNPLKKMIELSNHIAKGAMAFLVAEWRVLAVFAVFAAVILAWSGTFEQANSHPMIAGAFLIGAFFSALAGYFGMNIATKSIKDIWSKWSIE